MGELVAFWNFKQSTGRIWTLLYLSPHPLSADDIAQRTALSTGAVSMALAELQQWGLVDRAPGTPGRKRLFRAETDVGSVVRRIVRERELRLVGRSVARFAEGVEALEASLRDHPDDEEAAFMLARLSGLLGLARTGYGLVAAFAEFGRFTLDPILGALPSRTRDAGTG
jgi:DNA-binding transcriptional regulator GbsR (MarR family)